MTFKNLIAFFSLVVLSSNSLIAQPSELIKKVLLNLNLQEKDCFLPFIKEQVLPDSESKSIIIIPTIAELEDDYFSLNSYVLIVETSTGFILSQFFESHKTNNWLSDDLQLESIEVDLGPYNLNKETSAYGVRVKYAGSSRVNPYYNETISLFVQQKDQLKRILNNYEIKLSQGEWDGLCEGEFKEEKKTIEVTQNVTNGLFDIIIKNNITITTNTKVDDDCIDKETYSNKTEILQFNCTEYQTIL